jgi:hypothetical protein
MGIMEGRDTGQIKEKFRDLYQPALLTNWKVWPVAQVRLISNNSMEPNTHGFIAYKFPIHAFTLSRPIPIQLWCILDPVSISPERKVRFYRPFFLYGIKIAPGRTISKIDMPRCGAQSHK